MLKQLIPARFNRTRDSVGCPANEICKRFSREAVLLSRFAIQMDDALELMMTIPKWDDPSLKAGTMIRTALWLVTAIGVGNSFTKEDHRKAFVGIAQADRRLRDLRSHGWVIHTSSEDVTLKPNEQRLIKVGQAVWERGARKSDKDSRISAKKRMAAFSASNHQCTNCGIAAGEKYLDASHSAATLSVSRRQVIQPGGKKDTFLVTECNRCRAGSARSIISVDALREKISTLSVPDRLIFQRWAKAGRNTQLDKLWAEFRCLPADVKPLVLTGIRLD
jgi:hypothetical protein